ncbi:MAG: phosphatidylinositol-specific phospholipase C domain-containing protein [Pseudobutyrivibrio sp.]|nr:phosphatidylinositol-specific phospholipase C domain-containing protein [Pseudobutyrivibrio sp.]
MSKGRVFRIISGAMIAVIVVILIALFVGDDDTSVNVDIDMSKQYADTANWMSYLSDSAYLSEITLPGTHDSAARNILFGYAARCQDTSINQQLVNGYRYLDLRVAVDESSEGNKLKLVHGIFNCHKDSSLFSDYLYLQDITADIYKFLEYQPQETVVVNIKIEKADDSVAEVQKLLSEEIKSNRDYWYTDSQIPTLGEVRGKIVLATRFEDKADIQMTGLQMLWQDQNNTIPTDIPYELYVNDSFRLWVQDRYKYSVENKYEALVDGLENCEADTNTFFLNFLSTAGDGKIGHPRGYASSLNDLLLEYDLKDNTSYGIIIVDFGTPDLARHIYYTNAF